MTRDKAAGVRARLAWPALAFALGAAVAAARPAGLQAQPPAPAPAAAAASLKIGYVNLSKIFDGYERTKASDAVLQKRGKQKEAELEGRMNELKKMRDGLELLNDAAREAKTREIEQKSDELQRFRTATARDLRRDRDRAAKDILDEIQKMLEEHAKANGFALVMDSRSLLYGQGAYDLTDDILSTLNSRFKPAQ